MKRLFAILLAAMMLMSFAACGKNTADDTATTTSTEDTTAPEATQPTTAPATADEATADETLIITADITRGVLSDNTYKNDFAGLTFTADDTWEFASDSELAEKMGITEDDLTDPILAKTLAVQGTLYELFATKTNDENILDATVTIYYVSANDYSDFKNLSAKDLATVIAESFGIDIEKETGNEVVYGEKTYYQFVSTVDKKVCYVAACKIDDVFVLVNGAATTESKIDIPAMFS